MWRWLKISVILVNLQVPAVFFTCLKYISCRLHGTQAVNSSRLQFWWPGMSRYYCNYIWLSGWIFRCKLVTSQNNRTIKETSWEQDQGGYLRYNECDGLIITVGHKDQVSSSCITLMLLTPLPDCKCAQFRHPSSREQTNPNNLPSPTWSQISLCFSQNLY